MAQVIIKIDDVVRDGEVVAIVEFSTNWVQGIEHSKAVHLGSAVMEMLNYAREQVEVIKGEG
jgi:hypothetical protein